MRNIDSLFKSRDIKGPQSYSSSSSHVQMWELDYKEGWALKNWYFWTVVLEKTPENLLDCKEIKPVIPKGNQPWMFIGWAVAEAETPILWPPDTKSQLIGTDLDAEEDWGQEEKGVTEDGWLDSITDSMTINLSKLQEIMEDKRTWHASVHGVIKSPSWLNNWTTTRA